MQSGAAGGCRASCEENPSWVRTDGVHVFVGARKHGPVTASGEEALGTGSGPFRSAVHAKSTRQFPRYKGVCILAHCFTCTCPKTQQMANAQRSRGRTHTHTCPCAPSFCPASSLLRPERETGGCGKQTGQGQRDGWADRDKETRRETETERMSSAQALG